MPQISTKKEEKIKETIISILFQCSPKPLFTAHIAQEIARDEEYTKKLLDNLESKNIVIPVKRNQEGIDYKKRIRWTLSETAYNTYKKIQNPVL